MLKGLLENVDEKLTDGEYRHLFSYKKALPIYVHICNYTYIRRKFPGEKCFGGNVWGIVCGGVKCREKSPEGNVAVVDSKTQMHRNINSLYFA